MLCAGGGRDRPAQFRPTVALHVLGWLIFVCVELMVVVFDLGGHLAERFRDGIAWFFLSLSISLQAMVLAWQLPNEPSDEMA